jgi:hypothetical protein
MPQNDQKNFESVEKYLALGAIGFIVGLMVGLLLAGLNALNAIFALEKMFVISPIASSEHLRWTQVANIFALLVFSKDAFNLGYWCSLAGLIVFLTFTFLMDRGGKGGN